MFSVTMRPICATTKRIVNILERVVLILGRKINILEHMVNIMGRMVNILELPVVFTLGSF